MKSSNLQIFKSLNLLFFTTFLGGIVVITPSCYYDNLDTLNPKDTTGTSCDTSVAITYTKDIAPIMKSYCATTGCHIGNFPSGGLLLDNYTSVKTSAQSGKLYGSITWDGTTSQMPKGSSSKISDCSINKIKKWIATNYAQ